MRIRKDKNCKTTTVDEFCKQCNENENCTQDGVIDEFNNKNAIDFELGGELVMEKGRCCEQCVYCDGFCSNDMIDFCQRNDVRFGIKQKSDCDSDCCDCAIGKTECDEDKTECDEDEKLRKEYSVDECMEAFKKSIAEIKSWQEFLQNFLIDSEVLSRNILLTRIIQKCSTYAYNIFEAIYRYEEGLDNREGIDGKKPLCDLVDLYYEWKTMDKLTVACDKLLSMCDSIDQYVDNDVTDVFYNEVKRIVANINSNVQKTVTMIDMHHKVYES